MRWMAASSILLVGFASSAMADWTPIDPHALFATGGDATPISGTVSASLSGTGGGIFVYQNNTGAALSEVDANIQLPDSFLNGFSLQGTIFVPSAGQQSSFSSSVQTNFDCVAASTTTFCVHMSFALDPGPLVLAGGNFVLDFDKKGPDNKYVGVDKLVATGLYTGDTDTSDARAGEWQPSTQLFVTPIPEVPEPAHYAGLLAGVMALAIYTQRRRNSQAR
jgi:hypothetical protein